MSKRTSLKWDKETGEQNGMKWGKHEYNYEMELKVSVKLEHINDDLFSNTTLILRQE